MCQGCTSGLARRSLLTGLAAASAIPRAFAADPRPADAPNAISMSSGHRVSGIATRDTLADVLKRWWLIG